MKPSEQFLEAMRDSSSLRIMCEFCGRIYFAPPSEGDYDDGEYEDLVKKSKEEPDKYIETYDYTTWGYIDSKQAVIDCTCGLEKVAEWERWILRHRYLIAEYLDARANKQLEVAGQTRKTANKIIKAVKTIEGRAVRPGDFPAQRALDI